MIDITSNTRRAAGRLGFLAAAAGVWALAGAAATARADRVVLQVEEFDGPWRRQTNIKGYLGKGFCTSNANPKVAETVMRTTVRLACGGRHAVWVRAYTSANSRRALRVEVAGKKLAVTHKGRRRQWAWEKAGELDLPAGEVAVAIHDADVGYESADAVLLTDRKDEDPMAAERKWRLYGGRLPDEANALRWNIDACLAALRPHLKAPSKEAWANRREPLRLALRRALGLDPWPEKTPLHARVTGRAERDDYTIENVLFESRAKFFVTANVYKPKAAKGPLPAVVVVPGHAMRDGKNYDLYRTAQLGLVRRGFVVLSYDPIGQGERRRRGYSHSVGYAALLAGMTNEGVICWDTIRAVDYLLTRGDVDAERIGLSGNSGGGENTFYAMPIEPRFAAAASFCFVCSYHAWIKDGGNHCICNHLPGMCRGWEEYELVALNAPRPFLAGNGAKDGIFPIAGTRKTMRLARAIYGFADAADRVRQVDHPHGHGWTQPLREACYGWMAKWLQGKGDGSPIAEGKIELEDRRSKAVLCLKDGQLPAGARSYVQVVRDEAKRLIAAYPPVPQEEAKHAAWAKALRARLWQTLGGRPKTAPEAKPRGAFDWQGRRVERLAVRTESKLEVPALLIAPSKTKGATAAVIFLHDGGKAAVRTSAVARRLLEGGTAVLAMNVRATGEVKVHANHCASDAIVLGRPLLAQQAWDVIAAARCLAARKDVDAGRIGVYGKGSVGIIALLAAALSEEIGAVAAEGAIGSFAHAISDPLPQPQWLYAPSILKSADVPQLCALCAPRPLLWVNPVGISRKGLAEKEVARLAEAAANAYRARGAEKAFVALTSARPAERIAAFLRRAGSK